VRIFSAFHRRLCTVELVFPAADRSSLEFLTAPVFDPVFTMRAGVGVLIGSLAGIWLLGPSAGLPLLLLSVAFFWFLHGLDSRRPSCVSLRLVGVRIEDTRVSPTGVVASLVASEGDVARLRRRRQRVAPALLAPAHRVLPLAGFGPGWECRWVDASGSVPLDPEEIPGAVQVALAGAGVCVEVIVGGLPSRPAAPVAVVLSSSEGSLQCWDRVLSTRPRSLFTSRARRSSDPSPRAESR
jgi:hypothetical protein